ncbi:MAG TPA: hypothetical protein VH062_12625 [Polyangiaceae bacterium]|jgi:hypothetical protein|nr:hypothetical protein [Polyangiaceae bacterium]
MLASLALLAGVRDAQAAGCSPSTLQSTCFDADTLATPFAPSDFFMLSRPRAMAANSWSLGLDLTALHRPVTLRVPSPDPRGRELDVVGELFDGTLAVAGSPLRHLELGAALPFSLYRTGTGLTGVTSQTGPGLPRSAFRDLRFGAGYDIFQALLDGGSTVVNGLVRLDFSLPTGQSGSFAGERSVVTEPALDVGLTSGRFFASVEERVRLREPVTFGSELLGTQWLSALGVGVDVLDHERLRVGVEADVAPYLASRGRTFPDGTRVEAATLVPAEWMLSVRTRLDHYVLGLGGGTGIPLSSETRVDATGAKTSDSFASVTTPSYRFALTVRYVLPTSSPSDATP